MLWTALHQLFRYRENRYRLLKLTDGTNGLLYEVDSSKALKMCLIKMFSDVDLACQLGDAAKVSYEEKYSYEKMLRSYESLLL